MKAKVIGIRKSENQETKVVSSNLFLQIPFSDWESESALECTGFKVLSEYIRKPVDCKPGDEVDLVYEKGFQDKAILTEVVVTKRALDDIVNDVNKKK